MESLKRFEEAHQQHFEKAFAEIKSGKKLTHWMWFIFPQIKGLGLSETAKYYAIENKMEAKNFLDHPVLGANLRSITAELLRLKTNNPTEVLGKPDDMKLHSCMTLFSSIPGATDIFEKVLAKYFDGKQDLQTIKFLDIQE